MEKPFSSLIIGIWAAAKSWLTRSPSNPAFQFPHHRDLGCSFNGPLWRQAQGIFQFPHHRDLGCSSGKDRARDSSGDSFQFPHHRDLGCSSLSSYSSIFSPSSFSSLIIGIWAAALVGEEVTTDVKVFQFPHHRDLGCSYTSNHTLHHNESPFSSLIIGIWAAAC